MARYIYITKQKDFVVPSSNCSHIEFCNINKHIEILDDCTSNFDNLMYWNSKIHLHNKTAKEVQLNAKIALDKLKLNNVCIKQMTEDEKKTYILPDWWFGRRCKTDSCLTESLPNEERKSILMFHINVLYNISFKYDENHYFFISSH